MAELAYGQQRQLEIALALAARRASSFSTSRRPACRRRNGEVEIRSGLPGHIGYIIIEHDMDVALRVVESVTMMHNGRIFKEGSPQEIEFDPEASGPQAFIRFSHWAW